MTAVGRPWILSEYPSIAVGKLDWKISQSETPPWPLPVKVIDENIYNSAVLRLAPTASEDDLDDQIAADARHLGLLPLAIAIGGAGISLSSASTAGTSDSMHPGSIKSQSTAPTSCASSEHRPVAPSMPGHDSSDTRVEASAGPFTADKKKHSSFRRGFRKMAGLRKKSSASQSSPRLVSISSDSDTNKSDDVSIDFKSPPSIKSSKSSWPPSPAPIKSTDHPVCSVEEDPDEEAVRRSVESKSLSHLRMAQIEEKARFLEFQTSLLARLTSRRSDTQATKRTEHERVMAEERAKNDRLVEDLEARQLEEEMKMRKEHELEKRTVMIRLRHMEAYCQNPTPPPTPVNPTSGRQSIDATLPDRKITDKDYHNLAQQYRERDAMDTLHASKINVLWGRQKKAVENLMAKKEREMERLEEEHERDIDSVDREFASQETNLRLALDAKRVRLESRWKLQALIERTRADRATGLKHGPLPDVLVVELVAGRAIAV